MLEIASLRTVFTSCSTVSQSQVFGERVSNRGLSDAECSLYKCSLFAQSVLVMFWHPVV